ncbi:MFS transporter [Paenibacillus sp. URB8-2]|uniref:MFS transporter n=1 Tax=Paenibacillus sp. URB8-2 TaxID=2741301 RepID=UPI0015BF833E|nr:MFS transporter [Paenibacillus sp. URB8-2]BCG58797.1 putative MFS-type transporter YtbD [Paenibacillus sp. URB8-2]
MSTKIYLALFALAVSAFAIGTTEFVIIGLLQTVANDLGITITKAGTLVSGYAAAIAIGTPIVAALTGRLPKKGYLLFLMALFTAGNVLSALAGSYSLLMFSRVVTAVAHGVFFAVAATVAADMVPEDRKGTAISIMFTGLTVATILGVPFGTYIGQQFNWRLSFAAVAVLGLIGLLVVIFAVNKVSREGTSPTIGDVGRLAGNPRILLALLMTVAGFGGTFALFTYLSPILEEISGFSSDSISLLLLVYGIAVAVGNLAGGKLANGHPVKALRYVFLFQTAALLLQIWLLPGKHLSILSIILLGLFAFMMSAGVQTYVLMLAEKLVPSAKSVASALNISAFNIGIAAGSVLGGYAVDYMSYLDTAWIGAIMTAAAMALALINYRLDRRQRLFD